MELKGSKTEKNLQTAFAGESQARNKYDYFASVAKKEGYQQIAAFCEETSANEKEHAKIWAKHLGVIGTTVDNLEAAANGENFFLQIAAQFEGVAKIEKAHEERYRALKLNIENNFVFGKDDVVMWKCRNCGHIHIGKNAPQLCPVCAHPQAYFEVENKNY